MAVFLEFGKPAESDLIERQDHTGGLQLLPGGDQIFLGDLGLAIDDVLRSARKLHQPAFDRSKQRHGTQPRECGIAQLPLESRPRRDDGKCSRLKLGRCLAHHAINSVVAFLVKPSGRFLGPAPELLDNVE